MNGGNYTVTKDAAGQSYSAGLCDENLDFPDLQIIALTQACRLEELEKENQQLRGMLGQLHEELRGLISESSGVAGLHLNGDLATWDELLPGGMFERLSNLNEVERLLDGDL